MKTTGQKGFVGLVIVVLALAGLGAVGWYAYKHNTFGVRTAVTEAPGSTEQEPSQTQESEPVAVQSAASTNVTASGSTKTSTTTPQQALQTVGDNEVKIISPTEGQTFKGADKVTVSILIGKNVQYITPGVETFDKSGPSFNLIPRPADGKYSFIYTVSNNFIGPLNFVALGIIPNQNLSTSHVVPQDTVETKLVTSAKPISFANESEQVINKDGQLTLSAAYVPSGNQGGAYTYVYPKITFSDGVTRQIPASYLTITFSVPGIVGIEKSTDLQKGNLDDVVLLYGKAVGQTDMTMRYQNISITYHVDTYSLE